MIELDDFAENFALCDTDYDGYVDASDGVLAGDMDLNQTVDMDDVDDFVLGVLDPEAYAAAHGGMSPTIRGDFDGDGRLTGLDIGGFASAVIGGP